MYHRARLCLTALAFRNYVGVLVVAERGLPR